ncbi:hypothetical protein [Myxococcus hansupus]|uniref:hypothetical protein n=1 Tax=Pseudomyxococcus hansupus TaxID=1297742 RepID=UPI0005D0EDF5|nr:hypothetical protein [Myxococcus hansupus]
MHRDDEAETDSLHPTTVSEEERALGFKEEAIPSPGAGQAASAPGLRAVSMWVMKGKRAIKTASPDGEVFYAIRNEQGREVDPPVESLSVLWRRYMA